MSNKALVTLLIAILIIVGGIFYLVTKQRIASSPTASNQSQILPTEVQIKETIIELTSSGFSPRTVTINKNEGVRWINNMSGKATVNSDNHPTHKKFPEMNLGEFDKDETVSVILKKEGRYTYHNHYNPSQTGIVIVK